MALTTRSRLLCTTMIPLAVGVGVAAAGHAQQDCGPACAPAAASCNPCAPAACNPCAPAGCNPCAAAGCNPCAGGERGYGLRRPRASRAIPARLADGLTAAEAAAAYDCARTDIVAAYSRSGVAEAGEYAGWSNAAGGPLSVGDPRRALRQQLLQRCRVGLCGLRGRRPDACGFGDRQGQFLGRRGRRRRHRPDVHDGQAGSRLRRRCPRLGIPHGHARRQRRRRGRGRRGALLCRLPQRRRGERRPVGSCPPSSASNARSGSRAPPGRRRSRRPGASAPRRCSG